MYNGLEFDENFIEEFAEQKARQLNYSVIISSSEEALPEMRQRCF